MFKLQKNVTCNLASRPFLIHINLLDHGNPRIRGQDWYMYSREHSMESTSDRFVYNPVVTVFADQRIMHRICFRHVS